MNEEQYLTGAILIDSQVIQAIRGMVKSEDFQSENCRAIFDSATALDTEGEPVDPVSIRNYARRHGIELPITFLSELMEITPTAAHCIDYAHRVSEAARIRRIKGLAERIEADTCSTPDELLATIQREAEAIRGDCFVKGLLDPAASMHCFTDHVVKAESGFSNFIPCGFPLTDSLLGGGFLRGGLYIIGARPAVGKSTFALNLADNITGNVLFASLEMTDSQLTSKRVSRLTGIPAWKLLAGKIDDEGWQQVALATAALSEQGMYMNVRYDLTVAQIQLLAQAVPDLRAIIVDYLGLVQPSTRGASSYERITEVSRDLKRMAVSLNVPVVCLAQLSRSVESREDKRPRLSDLRDSGAIEQDADAVLFLFRNDYYEREGQPEGIPSLVELEVAKNRHGRTGKTAFSFFMSTSTFKEVP